MTFVQGLDALIVILTVSILICFIRLYVGPDLPNRTVAFDTIAIHAVGIIALFAIRHNSSALLSVAMVTDVLGFLGTTMLARYIEKAADLGWYAGENDSEMESQE